MHSEQSWWWPVALAADVSSQPLAVRLLDMPVVLWRNSMGELAALADRCPHRGAQLSLGRLVHDELQCVYHGWRFNIQGACTLIPSQPGFEPKDAHQACRYAVQETHGLVWVCLGKPAHALPNLTHLPERRLVYGPFDVATSAPRAVENFLDTSHFAFVHQGWLGDAAHPEVPPYDVTHTLDGRPVIEQYKAWQPRATAAASDGGWVTYRYEVLSPYSALFTKQPDAGGPSDSYTIWACPTTPESCRLWFAQYTTDSSTSDEQLRDFQIEIFSQDQPVLESQQPKCLPITGGEAMSAADRLSASYRRYLQAMGFTFGVC